MISEFIKPLSAAFGDALVSSFVVALKGGILFWGLLVGKVLATGIFEPPSRKKIAFISMPIAVVVSAFFAFYRFMWMVNPGETEADAIYDAEVTFFTVLLILWAGCIWGSLELNPVD